MKEGNSQVTSYSIAPVDKDGRQSWVKIFAVLAGMIFAVSKVVYGGVVGTYLPLEQAIVAIIIGNALLAAVTIPIAHIGTNTGLGAFEIFKYSFGTEGGKIITVLRLLAQLGWAGIGTILAIELLSFFVPFFATPLGFVVAGIVINLIFIATVWTGFKGLAIFSKLAVPAIILIFIAALLQVEKMYGIATIFNCEPTNPQTFFTVVEGVFFSWIGAVLGSPNTARFARSRKDASIAIILAIGLCAPIIYGVGAVTSLATGYGDVPSIFNALGLATLATILVVLLTWTTSSEAFYSTSLGFSSIMPIKNKAIILAFPFTIAVIFTLIDLYSYFTTWVNITGFVFCPVIGVMFADYYGFKSKYKLSVDKIPTKLSVASVVAVAVGITTNLSIPVYGALLGIPTSAITYYVLNRFVVKDKMMTVAMEDTSESEHI